MLQLFARLYTTRYRKLPIGTLCRTSAFKRFVRKSLELAIRSYRETSRDYLTNTRESSKATNLNRNSKIPAERFVKTFRFYLCTRDSLRKSSTRFAKHPVQVGYNSAYFVEFVQPIREALNREKLIGTSPGCIFLGSYFVTG